MKHLFPAYLLLIFFVSCTSEPENKEQLGAPSVLPEASTISPGSNDSSATLSNPAGVALNPAHGQPGHRCDLAVGAPLNPPTATNSAQTTVASNPAIIPANTPKTGTSSNSATATLNPKHGEPGHRCDIAVGAPLNSKPTQ
ncbi:MAG TPA: hypothetical protein VFP97_15445 [Chitinophagaceae bacterium]|nr:hypothetical protein [Chitinophagaceae bacterium]